MISLHHGESVSNWMNVEPIPKFSTLLEDIDVEIRVAAINLATNP